MTTDGMTQATEILEHIGVKRRSGRYKFGSGERPYQGVSKGLARKLKKQAKQGKLEDPNKQKPKSISEMTDDEIKAKIERLRLEQTLSQLMPKDPPPKESELKKLAKKVGLGVLEKSLDNIGTQGLTYFLGTAVNKAVNKRDEKGNLVEIVNPKKGQKEK